jgi:hypothetical protein
MPVFFVILFLTTQQNNKCKDNIMTSYLLDIVSLIVKISAVILYFLFENIFFPFPYLTYHFKDIQSNLY